LLGLAFLISAMTAACPPAILLRNAPTKSRGGGMSAALATTSDSDRLFFALLTLSLGKHLHRAASEWADTTIKLIEQHNQKGANKA